MLNVFACPPLSTKDSLSDEGWCCPHCQKEALPFHDCSDISELSQPVLSSCSTTSISNPQPTKGQFFVYYANCRSLQPKIDHLRSIAASSSPSVIAICETWLDESIPDSVLFIPDYHIVRRDRNRHGGDVLLYISDDIPSNCSCRHSSLELLVVDLKLSQGPLTLAVYYCLPSSALNYSDLKDAILSLTPSQLKTCVLLGDFNVDLFCEGQMSTDLTAMLSSFHFSQLVDEPTRVSKNTATIIDHVYLTRPSLLSSCSTSPPLGSSDHRSIQLYLNWTKCLPKKVTRRFWSYSRADWASICSDLESLPSNSNDADSFWVSWKSYFLSTLSSHIPTRVCRVKKSLPWMSAGLFKVLRKRDQAFSRYKATNSELHLSKFR